MQLPKTTHRFIHILGKIPMFQGLTPDEALEILKVCRPNAFSDRDILCEHGTKSLEMYILLAGTLMVTAPDGTPLTQLSPITIVGEMGLITGQPRSATVIVKGQVSVFTISKLKFDILMKKWPQIGFKIYRNIIHLLSQRLETNNQVLAQSQRELAKMRDQLAAQPTN